MNRLRNYLEKFLNIMATIICLLLMFEIFCLAKGWDAIVGEVAIVVFCFGIISLVLLGIRYLIAPRINSDDKQKEK